MRGHTTLCFKATWSEQFVVANVTSDLRPPAFCGHFHHAKRVASQDRFDCIKKPGYNTNGQLDKNIKCSHRHVAVLCGVVDHQPVVRTLIILCWTVSDCAPEQ